MAYLLPTGEAGIAEAAARLRAGRLVAFPTETVYGLGARADAPGAVAAVFRAKGRPNDHPLIVHLARPVEVDDWADPVPFGARVLAERFWPGPLTLVLARAAHVPDAITGGQPTIALRLPAHPVAAALLARVGGGVAAPSANRFGRVSPTRAAHVLDEFPDADIGVLDGGDCEVGLESTIIDLSGPRPRVLRPGAVDAASLAAALGRSVPVAGAVSESPRAPGGLPSHYAPGTPTRLGVPAELRRAGAVSRDAALLLHQAEAPAGHRGPVRRLPPASEGYARGLYAALRELDAAGAELLWVERPPEGPAWAAVHDRLERACAPPGRARPGRADDRG